jgi:hypothetical protein
MLLRLFISFIAMSAVACNGSSPVGPSPSRTIEAFISSLREHGLSASLDGVIAPEVNRFFSVPAHRIRADGSHISAFEYPTAEAAAAEAALISPGGQPSPTARITWVSTPQFYRQDRLIALYVGCSTHIRRSLEATLAKPFVIGATPCELAQ